MAEAAPERWAYEIAVQVPFRDLDALGHVNHTLFLRYMEDARTEWYMQLMGLSHPAELDIILAEATCTYHVPASWGDRLRCGVRPESVGNRSFVWVYRVWNEATGQTVATGRSVLVSFDYAAGRSKPVPEPLRAALAPWLDQSR